MRPYISIIVAVYNGVNYLDKCLLGIEKQTFKNFEVVFVDDASKDVSGKMIEDFQKRNSHMKVKYIKLESNQGIANAKNTGLLNSEGEYVLFHDQDDWMEPNCLSVLVRWAKNYKADKVVGRYQEIDENNNILRTVEYPTNFSKWFGTALHAVLFRRSLLMDNNILCPIGTQMEDGYLNSYFVQFTDKVVYVPKVVFNYFIRMNSTSGAKNNSEKWNSSTLLESALNCYYPLYLKMKGKKDKQDIEYMIIKQYWFYLLHNNRYVSYREAMMHYDEARVMIAERFPNYQNNKNIHLFGTNGDRKNGQRIVWLLNTIEKLYLIKLFWKLYLFISRFKYLNP